MKVAAIVAVLATGIMPGAEATERLTWNQRHHLVRYQGLENPDWTLRENRLTIRAAFHHYGMSAATALCVANRESHHDEDAYNSSSGASGLFQHLRSYWPGRVAAYNRSAFARWKVGTSPFNARANALVTAFMVKHGGWGPWGGGC